MHDPYDGDSPTPKDADDARFEVDLRDLVRIVRERWRVVAASTALAVLFALLANVLTRPEYVATAVMQVERQGPDILTFKEVVSTDPAWAAYQDFYRTQYRILTSRAVLRRAAEEIDLVRHPSYSRRETPPIRVAIGKIRSWLRFGAPGESAAVEPDPLDDATSFIAAGVRIDPVHDSHLVEISFLDLDPQLASDVANAIARAYQLFNLEARYSTTEEASDFLAREVARLKAEINDLERQLEESSREMEIVSLGDGARDISEQALSDVNTQYGGARARLAVAEARYRSVQDESANSLPEVLNSPLINGLKREYADLERRHSQLAERFKPGWPALDDARREMEKAAERLDIETSSIAVQVREVARSEFEESQAEVRLLEDQLELRKREVQRVNREAIEIAGLRDEIDTRREVLAQLVARRSQTEASGQLRGAQTSNIRIVDAAEPPLMPSRPRKLLNLFLGLFLGSSFGVALAFARHHLDNTVKGDGDIARYAPGLAVLGHVPVLRNLGVVDPEGEGRDLSTPDLASHVDPRSVFAESFRNLRTSLLLAAADHPPRSLVVTSCSPGDGKTTIALNLGIVLTQLGKSVLLVDADLRRPRVHRGLGLEADLGLSSYLSGNAELDEVVQGCSIPNLCVIASGPVPPNPSELLDSPALTRLMAAVQQRGFDHVVFDAPPALQVADGVIVASRVDTTILVVRCGVTTREALQMGVARLRRSRAPIAGAVLNAAVDRGGYYRYDRDDDRAARRSRMSSWRRARRRGNGAREAS